MPNDFLEQTLEDIIYDNRKTIHLRGFSKIKDTAFRQVILPSGKKIDILGFEINNGNLYCDIYELKRKHINADAICQAYNYYTELKCITNGHFISFNAKIIMVGREYEPVSIIDALPIPIEVYSYEYHMDGISFKTLHNPYIYSKPHPSFSSGLWAFGYGELTFTHEQSSVNLPSVYENYCKSQPDFDKKIKGHINTFVRKQNLFIETIEEEPAEAIKRPLFSPIITEIFPEQPAWTSEFANSIPPAENSMEDFENDLCDYEEDVDESDSDLEPDYDNESEEI